MHYEQLERGMWIKDLGIVLGTRAPGELGEMAAVEFIDPNDREYVMVTLTDDEDHYEELFDRGSHEWAEEMRAIIAEQESVAADALKQAGGLRDLLHSWTDGPPSMPEILEMPEGGNG